MAVMTPGTVCLLVVVVVVVVLVLCHCCRRLVALLGTPCKGWIRLFPVVASVRSCEYVYCFDSSFMRVDSRVSNACASLQLHLQTFTDHQQRDSELSGPNPVHKCGRKALLNIRPSGSFLFKSKAGAVIVNSHLNLGTRL